MFRKEAIFDLTLDHRRRFGHILAFYEAGFVAVLLKCLDGRLAKEEEEEDRKRNIFLMYTMSRHICATGHAASPRLTTSGSALYDMCRGRHDSRESCVNPSS